MNAEKKKKNHLLKYYHINLRKPCIELSNFRKFVDET